VADNHLPCVLFALPRERMFFHGAYRIRHPFHNTLAWLCENGGHQTLVVETGVGVENTLRAVDWLLGGPAHDGQAYRPQYILFGGFAGALHASLKVADLLIANEVIDMEGRLWQSSWPADGFAGARAARLLTASRFIGDPTEKLALGERFGAVAVDMETAAFARRCAEHNVPWGALRVISDDITRPVSRDVAELVEDSRVSPRKLARLLLRRPAVIGELWRLGRDTKRASRNLAGGLVQWLKCSASSSRSAGSL
jgi:adenosylhomocysteine nucleosidase